MVNSFNLHIKLYSLIFFVFIISTLNFYDKNGIVFLGSGFVAGLSFLFALKNYIYLKRMKALKKRYLNKIKKEKKDLNEYEFKEYIENKKDIEIDNPKYKNYILIDQIIYKGKFNEKTLASSLYKQKYGTSYE